MKRDHRIDVRPDIGHKVVQEDDDFELVDGQKISYMTVAEYPVSEHRGGAMLQPYWDGRCVFQVLVEELFFRSNRVGTDSAPSRFIWFETANSAPAASVAESISITIDGSWTWFE